MGVRVSEINCRGVSSMHTTGKLASYGRRYTSSTRSMSAAKSALHCGGITQPTRRHGLRAFFLAPAAPSRAKRCRCSRVPPRGPLRTPFGRLAATQRDQPRLELAVRLAQVLGTTPLRAMVEIRVRG